MTTKQAVRRIFHNEPELICNVNYIWNELEERYSKKVSRATVASAVTQLKREGFLQRYYSRQAYHMIGRPNL